MNDYKKTLITKLLSVEAHFQKNDCRARYDFAFLKGVMCEVEKITKDDFIDLKKELDNETIHL